MGIADGSVGLEAVARSAATIVECHFRDFDAIDRETSHPQAATDWCLLG